MRRWSQVLFGGAVASFIVTMALGQSSPGWQTGYVPPASEWNALWASKQDTLGYAPVNRAGDAMTGELKMPASTTANAMLKLPEGQAPSSPKNGDVWTTSFGVFAQIEGATVGPFGPTGLNVSCPQMPALVGDVTSVLGSCTTTVPNGVFTNRNQSFTKAQRATPVALSPSGATFTPSFDDGQNFTVTLVHASCPCTIANPSTTPVAGQTGVIEVIQSATGSDAVTWGSSYTAAGGTATIALSSAVNARDYLSYYVDDPTHIVVTTGALNAIH
jgi:hypothetical protein